MYALVATSQYGYKAELLATARSLRAIQKKWQEIIESTPAKYKCVGILTEFGLVNYHGEPILPSDNGSIALRMVVDYL